MADGKLALPVVRGFGETSRRDLWWVQPLAVFLGFLTFIVYSTWAGFQNDHYTYGPYLSPFYSPVLFASPPLENDSPEARRGRNNNFTTRFWGRNRTGCRRSCSPRRF